MTFPRRKFDEIFNIIREIRGLMAGFFAPQIPKQQFLIGFLVLSIVAWIGPKRRRGAMTRPSRNIRVDPSHVVNTGRIRRDINPGPISMFPECPGANYDIAVFELRDGNFPLRGSDGNTITAKRRLIAQAHPLEADWHPAPRGAGTTGPVREGGNAGVPRRKGRASGRIRYIRSFAKAGIRGDHTAACPRPL